MADSADLVVLGAWFGTGNKGILHIFDLKLFIFTLLFFWQVV